MIITAIDTNILIDLVGDSGDRQRAASGALEQARTGGALVLSVVSYAELLFYFKDATALETFLMRLGIVVQPLEQDAAALAGQHYREYRERGGPRARILADFLIAAHAQLRADRLLTRDARFFGEQFPDLHAVHPDQMQTV